ncbi:MAG: hypothetical protein ACXVEF_00325 [Polyangiales bacterium]
MTLTEWSFFKLFECLDGRGSIVDAELRVTGEGDRLLARGRVEPMFSWRAGEPFLWERADLEREVPSTSDASDAGDLAWGAARHLSAFAVYRDESKWESRLVGARYHAVFDFESLELDAAETRAPRVRQHVVWQLRQLADSLEKMFVRYGSAGGREYTRRVSESAALVFAFAVQVARDLPLRTDLEALVATMNDWALRAGIPMDEALRVSVDVRAAADEWAAPA